jgi:hypothetical protein
VGRRELIDTQDLLMALSQMLRGSASHRAKPENDRVVRHERYARGDVCSYGRARLLHFNGRDESGARVGSTHARV